MWTALLSVVLLNESEKVLLIDISLEVEERSLPLIEKIAFSGYCETLLSPSVFIKVLLLV